MENIIHHSITNKLDKLLLSDEWRLFKAEPNQYQSPNEFDFSEQELLNTTVPSTVAMAKNGKEPGCWEPSYDYDDYDWWYRFEFNSLKDILDFSEQSTPRIYFDGLATFCEVWLNGNKLLTTNNMFRGYILDLKSCLKPRSEERRVGKEC